MTSLAPQQVTDKPVVSGAGPEVRPKYYSENNFDLIRLVAAAEVVLGHSVSALNVPAFEPLAVAVGYFAGVPAFFFVSGFLITAAWYRRPELRHFYGNRCYRIFPALWMSVALSLIALALFARPDTRELISANEPGLFLWALAQATFAQVWNPEFLRLFGIGVMNGSLWTIPVELSFYAIVPFLPYLFRRIRADYLLPVLIVLSFALNYWVNATPKTMSHKLVMASPFPWVGMFLLGMLVQRHIDRIYPWIAGRVWAFLALFVGVSVLSAQYPAYPFLANGNSMGILNYLAEVGLVLSAAYSYRWVSDKVLRRNDLSYGIYIGHMIILNSLVEHGMTGLRGFAVALPLIVLLAMLSWTLLEKPILARRRSVALTP